MATSKGVHRLSITDLLTLSKEDPALIVETLKNDLKGFQESLNSCHKVRPISKGAYIASIITILNKVCQAKSYESANIIIAEFLSDRCSQFHALLKEYVLKLEYGSPEIETTAICKLFQCILIRQPSAWHVLPIDDLVSVSAALHEKYQKQVEEIKAQYDRICNDIKQQRLQELKNKIERQEECKKELFKNWDNSQYRKISILPTIHEVRSHKAPLLRSNLINSCYDSWEHYYDVQFRLLREDFLAPLRRGIQSYAGGARGRQLHDIIIYQDVILVKPEFTRQGTCFRIRINTQRMRSGWEHSKKLIFGSLLCFSYDGFKQSIYFATVVERELKDMQKYGEIIVKFESNAEMLGHCQTTRFIVAESRAYYEASSHILRSLQLAETDTMPFTSYLIRNDCSEVKPPGYLSNSATNKFNLMWLYPTSLHHDLALVSNPVDLLQPNDWPLKTLVQLDESQLDAVKMALTQEISVIQGPPGTGKTYIGYKIVQTLLQNRNVWDPHLASPILVMCLTNHALDQFLEGLLDSHIREDSTKDVRQPRIVRVGGQSVSERIQQLNINKIRGWVPGELLDDRRQLIQQLEASVKRMPWRSLCMSVRCTVDEYIVGPKGVPRLEKIISPKHFYQLSTLAKNSGEEGHILELWLGMWEDAKTFSFEEKIPPKKLQHLSITQSQVESETIAIAGEGVIESQLRMIDDDSHAIIQATEDEEENHIKYDQQKAADMKFPQRKRKRDSEIKRIIQLMKSNCPMAEEEVIKIQDVRNLSLKEKYKLFLYWIQKYQEELKQLNDKIFMKYNDLCKQLKETQQKIDRYALEKAEVIGMTTTGAAKYQHIIHLVKPKIVIVEEAAEVMESHIVSALSAGTQHLILIGDHKQLRPKPNEYDLAIKHNLHISLFERLIESGLPHATLLNQHRMRPEIARLVHPHIYDKLENHDTVKHYQDIKGFKKNMYFFDHEHEEEEDDTSHSNAFEAEFAAALCKHILNQGYKPSEITILTPYTGQLFKLKNCMPKSQYEGVRVTCVDNFQGEENNVIILSLVRSNKLEKVGFLKEDNRVCVALSRAKMGLYCFGNFKLLRQCSLVWKSILEEVEKAGCLGSALELHCHNHPSYKFLVHCPDEIRVMFPDGGCFKKCAYRLNCGHSCKRYCHPDDIDHSEYMCMESCAKTCTEGHACTQRCYQDCPPCKRLVTKKLPCSHEQIMQCCEKPEEAVCLLPCKKLCLRGIHECKRFCSDPCGECQEEIATKLPKCGHTQMVKCSVAIYKHLCTEKVVKRLSVCGHDKVVACHQFPHHSLCSQPCLKQLACGHMCKLMCGEACKCSEKVQVVLPCSHQITKYCGDKSVDCTEIVMARCPKNHTYNRKCCEPAKVCDSVCGQPLECGHMCTKKCSEDCGPCTITITETCSYGHSYKFQCPGTLHASKSQCPEKCTVRLQCGHMCTGKCGECHNRRIHSPCTYKLDLHSICGHSKRSRCVGLQFTCIKRCSLAACSHRKCCNHRCWKECQTRCRQSCIVRCEHKKCSQPCDAPCSQTSCDANCDKLLACGHVCPGLCGEKCLTYCVICDRAKFVEITSKYKCASEYASPEAYRYIQLECSHIFTVKYMDKFVAESMNNSAITPLHCPACSKQLTSTKRYWKATKQRILEIMAIKKKSKTTDDTVRNRFNIIFRAANNHNVTIDAITFTLYSRTYIKLPETTETTCWLDMIEFAGNVSDIINSDSSDLSQINELTKQILTYLVDTEGALSYQLISDITSELYRIALCQFLCTLQSKLLPKKTIFDRQVISKFDEVQKVLDEMENDHSIRISGDLYERLYSDLHKVFKIVCPSLSRNYDISCAITVPKATKGEWHKCTNGHIYFVPATFTKQKIQCKACIVACKPLV